MNRNQESHFAQVPRMNHPRSTFDRSHSLATSFNFGEVIPILCEEILPGDTVQLNTSKILRMQTLLAPAFANMYADTYYFFIPNRIIWDHWKEFMGENTQSSWYPTVEYKVPGVCPPVGGFRVGSVADYLGYPVNIDWHARPSGISPQVDQFDPSCLPLRAYAMVCNEFFRDQNLSEPVLINTGDTGIIGRNDGTDLDVAAGGNPYHAAKFKDLFTMCVPSPQKGPSVTIPVEGSFPVVTGPVHGIKQNYPSSTGYSGAIPMFMGYYADETSIQSHNSQVFYTRASSSDTSLNISSDPGAMSNNQYAAPVKTARQWPTNLWALGSQTSGVLGAVDTYAGIDINALRLGVLTQSYYERLAMAGSRYEEQLNAFFGITNPDSRVNHPEYLGGSRVSINVNEVTNNAQSEADFLGDVGAKSVTADTHFDVNKSFTEHGILLGVVVSRYDHIHTAKGMPRWMKRRDKFDFYNPMFSNIGYQPVYEYELYCDKFNNADSSVFGYNEAWIHYRTAANRISAGVRPQANTSLAHWSLADNFASAPVLSDEWIKEDKTPVDRITAVSSSVAPQMFADFYFHLLHTRPMPMYSVPGAVGAF